MNDNIEISRIYKFYNELDSSDIYKKKTTPISIYAYHQYSLFRNLYFKFKKNNFSTLENLKILDIGIGKGSNISDFIKLGLKPKNLFGLDILLWRLKYLQEKFILLKLVNSNACYIPFKNREFDIVTQFVVFS
ncbi:MAG TPA: class I SAM-dependent methyltransferase, partial [bacterium]|nr:class I SAM-dependent methyltransferase [bacterium]